jgi:hypothetical protein
VSDVVAAAQADKEEGQARAGRKLTSEHWAAFVRALDTVPAGQWFTANDLRAALAVVPQSARATLFARAAHAGLIEKVTVTRGGRTFELGEKSDGRSARRKPIAVYQRMSVPASRAAA